MTERFPKVPVTSPRLHSFRIWRCDNCGEIGRSMLICCEYGPDEIEVVHVGAVEHLIRERHLIRRAWIEAILVELGHDGPDEDPVARGYSMGIAYAREALEELLATAPEAA